ncbi:hypothetical protein BV20DRAFT_1053476 [Pilatotrama ljubarskyi]|nr:hypothetical protein BV20DRAFT_1053476 [Pilatotrama ljubarskyi]
MPTWDLSSVYSAPHSPPSKPALSPTLSKRRGQQLRSACRELADTPPYNVGDDQPNFPRRSSSSDDSEDLRDKTDSGEHEERVHDQNGSAPRAFTQRTIRRKKSSFDLRVLFLTGEGLPSRSRASSDA